MVPQIQQRIEDNERRFLLPLVCAELERWLRSFSVCEHPPGILWNLRNLEKLREVNTRSFAVQVEVLAAGFDHIGCCVQHARDLASAGVKCSRASTRPATGLQISSALSSTTPRPAASPKSVQVIEPNLSNVWARGQHRITPLISITAANT